MNALAEPVELLEAECNAQALPLDERDDELDEALFDEACSMRVVEWMVQRICSMPH